MNCGNIQDADEDLMLSPYRVLGDDGKAGTPDNFLKHDCLPDQEDLGSVNHIGRNFHDDEMFRRLQVTGPVTTLNRQPGNDALDLSLTRHGEDSNEDDFDDDDDSCATARESSPYLQQVLQDMHGMNRRKSPTSEMSRVSPNDGLLPGVWPSDGETPVGTDSGLPSNWHLPLNGPAAGLVGPGQDLDLLSGSSSLADDWTPDGKDLAGVLMDGRQSNPWSAMHDSQVHNPLMHWGGAGGGSPNMERQNSAHDVLNSQSLQALNESAAWSANGDPKGLDPSWSGLTEGKVGLEHPDALENADAWEKQIRPPHQSNTCNNWQKNLAGEMYSGDNRGQQSMYHIVSGEDMAQKVNPAPAGYTVITSDQPEHKLHYRMAMVNNNNSRIVNMHHRPETPIPMQIAGHHHVNHGAFIGHRHPHIFNQFAVQQRPPIRGSWEHGQHLTEFEANRAQLRQIRPQLVSTAPDSRLKVRRFDCPRARPVLERAPTISNISKRSHPYKIKEQKAIVRDVQATAQSNVQTLQASHIVSWYIDYLIHENEDVTQISRAFSLPVNLFHSDDFYFMDTLKKKVHFPSQKFLSWMQQNFPSINVNAVDFHQGRAPGLGGESQSSGWGQDRSWDNKSRRDIIHDVFYFFQRQQQQHVMMRSSSSSSI